jgi:hypothetical protein
LGWGTRQSGAVVVKGYKMNNQTIDAVRTGMYNALPGYLQYLLTAISGRPHSGQIEWNRSAWHFLISAIAWELSGTLGLYFAIANSYWGLAPFAFIAGVHGLHKSRLTVLHACSHFRFTRDSVVDGASAVLVDALGANGVHTRTAVGCSSLPSGELVKVDAVFQIA